MDRRSYIFSACLHVAIILIFFIGLPWFSSPPNLAERVISVDILADSSLLPTPPLPSEKTEAPKPVKPQPTPEVKQTKPEPEPKPESQPEPKQAKPAEQPQKPQEEQAPSLADEPAKEVIQNKPTETPKPQSKPEEQAEATPVPKPLPQPKAPAPPAETPKPAEEKKQDQAFDKLLSSLDEKPSSSPNKLPEDQMGDTLDPSEESRLAELLSRQIKQYWTYPIALDKPGVRVQLQIEFEILPDGTVLNPIIKDKTGNINPELLDASAKSLQRAALEASPLKIPPDLYNKYKDRLKETVLDFKINP